MGFDYRQDFKEVLKSGFKQKKSEKDLVCFIQAVEFWVKSEIGYGKSHILV